MKTITATEDKPQSEASDQQQAHSQQGLFPHLCDTSAIFGLVLAGELLAFALVLAQNSLSEFSWSQLGSVSMIVQWIVLSSAFVLCCMEHIFARLPIMAAGSLAYGSILLVAVVVISLAQYLLLGTIDVPVLLKNMLLAAIFSGIFLRYLYIQQQLRNQQQAELEARIQALHARIRPHFLFNSMNTIASLITIDPPLAEKVVEDLSELFRVSLQETSLVTLEEEMDLCRSYVEIEEVRLGERLQIDWQCDQYPKRALIPSLALQPLIENAIYHGIQRIRDGGVITIMTYQHDNELLIKIANPVPDKMTKPRDVLPNMKSNRVAQKNIQHRLQAHYGKSADMTIHRENIDGVEHYIAAIHIPLNLIE